MASSTIKTINKRGKSSNMGSFLPRAGCWTVTLKRKSFFRNLITIIIYLMREVTRALRRGWGRSKSKNLSFSYEDDV